MRRRVSTEKWQSLALCGDFHHLEVKMATIFFIALTLSFGRDKFSITLWGKPWEKPVLGFSLFSA
jgi:hypothetical protein